jgi:hypothetical protein
MFFVFLIVIYEQMYQYIYRETTYEFGILTSPAEISTTRAGRVVVIGHNAVRAM